MHFSSKSTMYYIYIYTHYLGRLLACQVLVAWACSSLCFPLNSGISPNSAISAELPLRPKALYPDRRLCVLLGVDGALESRGIAFLKWDSDQASTRLSVKIRWAARLTPYPNPKLTTGVSGFHTFFGASFEWHITCTYKQFYLLGQSTSKVRKPPPKTFGEKQSQAPTRAES